MRDQSLTLVYNQIPSLQTAYLLDLQSFFPLATKDNDSRDWRTYALELEKQLATLKAQRDADQERTCQLLSAQLSGSPVLVLSKFPTDASQAASTSDAPPPKKKSKKNPTKDQHDPEWSWDKSRTGKPISANNLGAYTLTSRI